MEENEKCRRLHEALEQLPIVSHPFDLNQLPRNGIYFFYEKGERWGHGGPKPRIVRVGTHRSNNFRSRIADHYLIGRRVSHEPDRFGPKDRSIFRKNLGRAVLNRDHPDYLETWNIDYTPKENREEKSHLRNMSIERETEEHITRVLRENFSFRFVRIEKQEDRLGTGAWESILIGTLATCDLCKPSENWLGNHSPLGKIKRYGLWQIQHLRDRAIDGEELIMFERIIKSTLQYTRHHDSKQVTL